MALKILLADPDKNWLKASSDFLQKNMFEVDIAENGKNAQLAFANNKYFSVVIAYNLQDHSSLQVIKFIRSKHPTQRLIMIIDEPKNDQTDENIISKEKLEKMGINEVLTRPVTPEALAKSINSQQKINDLLSQITKRDGVSKEEEVSIKDSQFTKIHIDELYSSNTVLFDLYVQLSNHHYVKILHSGDTFSQERIDKYKNEKKVQHLFFLNEDRQKYLQFTNMLTKQVIPSDKVSGKVKIDLLKNAGTKFLEEIDTDGLKPQIIEQGKEICTNMYATMEKQKDMYKLLRDLHDFDADQFTHAFLVSMFASSIVKQFDWLSQGPIETAAMAGLLHDIGKTQLPKELLLIEKKDMNEEQLTTYKTHSTLGAEILQNNRMISNSISQIVGQHHEHFDGTGFPRGIKATKITVTANIICLANDFAHLIQDDGIKPIAAVKKILSSQELTKRYNPNILERFVYIFAHPDQLPKQDTVPQGAKVIKSA